MKLLNSAILGILLAATLPTLAVADIRKEAIQFARGTTGASVSGRITGDQTVDYTLRAKAGQTLHVHLKADSAMAYFNVLPPGSTGEAVFIGSTLGDTFEGKLDQDGEYTVRVYQMRAGARRGESAQYTLTARIDGGASTATGASAGFDQTLEMFGVTFHVTSPNAVSGNTVKITPSGLSQDNSAFTEEVTGTVLRAEVADLNIDQSPEVYVYVKPPGDLSRMQLVAYSANRKASLSDIFLPPIEDIPGAADGFAGQDDMAVIESVFARRFSIGGGKMRQLQYKLVPGEAGWRLKFDRMDEF
jgi:hypothetical protein